MICEPRNKTEKAKKLKGVKEKKTKLSLKRKEISEMMKVGNQNEQDIQQQAPMIESLFKPIIAIDLFNQTAEGSNKSESEFYTKSELEKIVSIIRAEKILFDSSSEGTVVEAISNYSLRGGEYMKTLFEEIEILKEQLRLSPENVVQLQSIIINVKKE